MGRSDGSGGDTTALLDESFALSLTLAGGFLGLVGSSRHDAALRSSASRAPSFSPGKEHARLNSLEHESSEVAALVNEVAESHRVDPRNNKALRWRTRRQLSTPLS